MQLLRTSLFRTPALLTCAGLVLLSVFAIGIELTSTRQRLEVQAHLLADVVGGTYLAPGEPDADPDIAGNLTDAHNWERVCLYDAAGRRLNIHTLPQADCPTRHTDVPVTWPERLFTHTDRIRDGERTIGWVSLSIGPRAWLAASLRNLVGIVLLALSLGAIGVWLAARHAARLGAEVQRIRAAAAAMGSGEVPADDGRMSIAEFDEVRQAIGRTARSVRDRIGEAERELADRQRAEAALANSENRLRRIIDEVPQAVFAVAPQHELLFANRSVARLYGRSPAALMADPAVLFRDPWLESVPTVVVGTAEGSRVLEVHRMSIPLDTDLVGVLVVANDVTEARRMQSQLYQASRMQAIGQLAGGIAHEFNNLLTPINGHAELLKSRVHEPELQHRLDAITGAATRARQLIRQVLSFSRNTEQLFERTPIGVGAVISEVALLMRGSLPSSIELRTQVERGLPRILADAGQLHQVLVNLCTNAAQAINGVGARAKHGDSAGSSAFAGNSTDDLAAKLAFRARAGRIDIIADVVHADDLPDDISTRTVNGVRIRVIDNGAGMPPEVMTRAFEPFFSTKPSEHGTGLGLAVAKGIVEAHGGRIRVDSGPGRGTCFEILLPGIGDEATAAPEPPAQDARPSAERTRRVLLVDDDSAVLLVTGEMLRALGYQVVTAPSAERALEIMAGERATGPQPGAGAIDLVITDNSMPGMDGNHLARLLRANHPKLPIVMLTGLMEVEPDTAGAINLHLMKPVGLTELERAIGGLLGSADAAAG